MSEPSTSVTASAALASVVPTAGAVAPVTSPISTDSGKPSLPSPRAALVSTKDLIQEPVRAKLTSSPGFVVPAPSFTYSVLPRGSPGSGNLQPSPSNAVFRLAPDMPAAALQPPVPGQALGSRPSFSYSVVSHANANTAPGQQFPPAAVAGHAIAQGGKTVPLLPAAFLQPPVPRQPLQSNQGLHGAISQNFQPQRQFPFLVPTVQVSAAMSFSCGGDTQLATREASDKSLPSKEDSSNAGALDNVMATSSALNSQPAELSVIMPANSSTNQTTCSSYSSTLVQVTPPLAAAAVSEATGPKGTHSSTEFSTPTTKPESAESSQSLGASASSSVATTSSSASTLLHLYSPHQSLPATVPRLQTPWLHQSSPFVPYQGGVPSPHSLPLLGMPSPSTSSPRAQTASNLTVLPHGGLTKAMLSSQSGSSSRTNVLQQGTDLARQMEVRGTETVRNEVAHAWTAHSTETGAIYYYNSLTGVSTYERPPEFKGDANLEKAPAQSTPVKWEKLDGTDWTVVITNDGKTYYYDTKHKVSSWQLPPEVADLRKNQERHSKGNTSQVQSTSITSDNGSDPAALSAPAMVTGGRESVVVRPSNAQVSSSTLDLVKKKLQDAGTFVTSSPHIVASGPTVETDGSRETEGLGTAGQTSDNKEKAKDANGEGNISDTSSDSDDGEIVPSKEDCIRQFKEMLKERGVAPFSKWDKELPKIVFDPRFKAIPGYAARRAIFEKFVRTRAEEERKEKRAAQKIAIDNFKQLLEEASEDIDSRTDYEMFKRKWGSDRRFQALDRKEREQLLNEKVIPLKKAAEEKIQAAIASFKSMLRDKGDITTTSRWSKVKDSLRDDPRYVSVKHEDRERLFIEYLSELKAAEEEAERAAKVKQDEQEKLRERERDMRKRKEREEQEMERVKLKVRRKEAISSYQALLVETIKDPKASWTECKPKLEKDPQNRAKNADLAQGDAEKLFREHVKELHERCARDYRSLLAEVITLEAASKVREDGKTCLNFWSEAKRLLKSDPRYDKMPRKDRESLWLRYTEEMTQKQKSSDMKERMDLEGKSRSSDLSRRSPRRSSHSRR